MLFLEEQFHQRPTICTGIGRATSLVLAQRGFKVVIADVAIENGEAVVAEIVKTGGKAKFIKLDVGSPEEWTSAGMFLIKIGVLIA